MSNNKSKAAKLAEISKSEIQLSRVIPQGFYSHHDLIKLRNLEGILASISSHGSLEHSWEEWEIVQWENDLKKYCNERDRLILRAANHYSHLISKEEDRIKSCRNRLKVLERQEKTFDSLVNKPRERYQAQMKKLGDVVKLNDYLTIGGAGMKGVKEFRNALVDKAKGDAKDAIFITQQDVIDKGLDNLAKYYEQFDLFKLREQGITHSSFLGFYNETMSIIKMIWAAEKRIINHNKKNPAFFYGLRTPAYDAYFF